MKPYLISILLILALSCNTKTNSWQTLDFGPFKLKAPSDWKILKERGIDSYVGGLTNTHDTLWFDYGAYELNFGEDSATYLMATDTINGLKANIYFSEYPKNNLVVMQMPIVNKNQKFTLTGRMINNPNLVWEILKSVVFFDNNNTAFNSSLKDVKFNKVHYLSIGNLILEKCGNCHLSESGYKSLPLKDFIQSRSADWLYNFIINKGQLKTDSTYMKRRQGNQIHCPEFPSLTNADVLRIKEFYKCSL